MTKASDNPFPSILVEEGTEPAAPAAGHQRLYISSSTHRLMRTDSSGTEVEVGATGDVASDAIWDAKGDLAVGTAANTAQKLTVGANGKVLMAASGEATGLKWETPAAGGGVTVPTVVQRYRGVNSPFTIDSTPVSGNRLVVGFYCLGGSVTGVSSDNTTWAQVGSDQSQNGNNTSVWVGIAAGSAGKTITVTKTGTSLALVLEVADALTPAVGTTVTTKETGAVNNIATAPTSAITAGNFVAFHAATDAANNNVGAMLSCPFTGMVTASQYSAFVIGYAPDGDVLGIGLGTSGSSAVAYLVEIT